MMNNTGSTSFVPQTNSLKFINDCCEDILSLRNITIINIEKE